MFKDMGHRTRMRFYLYGMGNGEVTLKRQGAA
jgi:hypothetical protein